MKPITCALFATALSLPSLGIFAQTGATPTETGATPSGTGATPAGAGALAHQDMGPVGAIHAHLCGFHFYNGDMSRQVRAEHYCSHLNADVWQCIIYESDKKNARLIGVEYIISEKLFNGLPPEEKKLWHSHRYEVMSGQLIAPGMPDEAEKQLMKEFVTTYGKTWYLWQVDRGDALPIGLPRLIMGFTGDGQADPAMVSERDRELKVDSTAVKAKRADIPTREIAPGADAWQHGQVFQLDDSPLTTPGETPRAPSSPPR